MSASLGHHVSRRIVRESFLYLLSNLANRALGFLMIPLYSHCLSPSEYGVIEVIELTTQVVSLLVGFGIGGAALVRVAQDKDSLAWQHTVSSTSIIGTVLLNILAAVVVAFCASTISLTVFGTTAYASLLRATVSAMALGNIVENCLCYVRLKKRAGFQIVYSFVALLFTVSLNIWFIAFEHSGVWGFVFSKLAVAGTGSLFLVVYTLREVGLQWNTEAAISMFRFGAPLGLSYISFFVLHFGDRFFLSRLADLREVGNYALAYRFAFLVNILVGEPFGRSWNVALYGYLGEQGWQERFRRVGVYLSTSVAAVALAIALFAGQVMSHLVPPSYYPAFAAIPVLVAAYALRDIGDFFRELLFINKRSVLVGCTAAAVAILNTVLNFMWIPSSRMIGAAWATFAAWCVYALVLFTLAERELHVGFSFVAIGRAPLAAVACFIISLVGRPYPPLVQFGVNLCSAMFFCAVLWRSAVLTTDEKSMVMRRLRSIPRSLQAVLS